MAGVNRTEVKKKNSSYPLSSWVQRRNGQGNRKREQWRCDEETSRRGEMEINFKLTN